MKLVSTTLFGLCSSDDLGKALASVAPIVDECCVIWTGESQEIPSYLKNAALGSTSGKAVFFTWLWRDHFGEARQEALDIATKRGADWCLWIDSDEWFDPGGEDIRAVLERTDSAAVNMFDGTRMYVKPKAIRIPCQTRWIGPTHEYIGVAGPTFERACFYERAKTPDEILRKRHRDIKILEAETKRVPKQCRWWYYLGEAYEGIGDYDKALEAYYRRFDMEGWDEEDAWTCYKIACIRLFNKPNAYSALPFDDVIDICMSGIARHPGIAELFWIAGIAAYKAGRHAHAVYFAELARTHGKSSKSPWNALAHRVNFREHKGLTYGPADIEQYALLALGDIKGAEAAKREVVELTQSA
jgi:tetratricopeptide (TPR) repeat protein